MKEKGKILKKLLVSIISISMAIAFFIPGLCIRSKATDYTSFKIIHATYYNTQVPKVAVNYFDPHDSIILTLYVLSKTPGEGDQKITLDGQQYYSKLTRWVEGENQIIDNSDGTKSIPANSILSKTSEKKAAVGTTVKILIKSYDENYNFNAYDTVDIKVPAEGKSSDDKSDNKSGGSGKNKENAKTITPPKGKKLVYTGKAQVGVKAGTGYTVTGNKATKVGTHTAVAKLKKGYIWEDGTKDNKKIIYTIHPRDNSITIKKTMVEKTYKKADLKEEGKTFTLPKATAEYGQSKLYYKITLKPDTNKIAVGKDGKVTVKKGITKNTYAFIVKAYVPKSSTYKAATSESIKVTIRVR